MWARARWSIPGRPWAVARRSARTSISRAGRIAGVSGISARAFGISDGGISRDGAWAFLIGLPLGAAIVGLLGGGGEPQYAETLPLVVAGLLVGVGTRLGGGCTSGHGECGVSRLS